MTKIEWTEATWNPIVGCSIVSPGCTNCYAMRMAARLEAMATADKQRWTEPRSGAERLGHYLGTTQRTKAGPVWTEKVAMAPDRILTEPLRRRKPTTYFVNSMGDLFHEHMPDEWVDRVFAVMALAPQHTFQVLTKRAKRMRDYIGSVDLNRRRVAIDSARQALGLPVSRPADWPLPNVWLGVSAERQREADERIPDLLATPAAIRFVSAEPLLGPVDFTCVPGAQDDGQPGTVLEPHEIAGMVGNCVGIKPAIDWVIVGGESGPGARPMHPEWVRSIRDQCTAAGVPFFFKQWGEWLPSNDNLNFSDGEEWAKRHFPGRRVQQHSCGHTFVAVGKRLAGRNLDGRAWDEVPAPSQHPARAPAGSAQRSRSAPLR